MSIKSVLINLAALSVARGHVLARNAEPRCGTVSDGEDYSLLPGNQGQGESIMAARQQDITVDLVFHVLAGNTTREGGYMSQADVDAQLAVIVDNYAPHGIHFNFLGARYDVNASYITQESSIRTNDYKTRLHEGTYATLNLYFPYASGMTGNAGSCSHPEINRDEPDKFETDGCVIRQNTLPGSNRDCCNEGKTAVHEIGHWFGLWHIFEHHCKPGSPGAGLCSGCSGPGDFVDDTPATARPSYSCREGADSCYQVPGLDPIHNFMGYEYDACINEFTPGQAARMHMIWEQYRASYQ